MNHQPLKELKVYYLPNSKSSVSDYYLIKSFNNVIEFGVKTRPKYPYKYDLKIAHSESFYEDFLLIESEVAFDFKSFNYDICLSLILYDCDTEILLPSTVKDVYWKYPLEEGFYEYLKNILNIYDVVSSLDEREEPRQVYINQYVEPSEKE